MQILDQAVELIRKRGGNGPQVASRLEALASLCDEAARIWKSYIDTPGAPGDKYTLVSWMGAGRANELYELSLKAKVLVDEVRAGTGPQARLLVLDESPIVMAYVQLKDGETGPQAARDRLTAQQAMSQHLRSLAGRVRSVKPGTAKAAGKPAVKKKAVKQKPPKKAAAKKKTTAQKKAVGKKPARKPAKKAPKKK
jgi:hypothetical protein